MRREAKVSLALLWPSGGIRQKVQSALIQNKKSTNSGVVEPENDLFPGVVDPHWGSDVKHQTDTEEQEQQWRQFAL